MRVRHAAVVAGLALGLMSGTAQAATLSYSVSLQFSDGNNLTGTITTDKKAGVLSDNDVISFDLFFRGYEFDSSVHRESLSGDSLYASGNSLNFLFDGLSNSQLGFSTKNGRQFFSFNSGSSVADPYILRLDRASRYFSSISQGVGTILTIGTSKGTVSPVPLPASAPMFGAAVLVLGAIGYGAKRKKAAAAA